MLEQGSTMRKGFEDARRALRFAEVTGGRPTFEAENSDRSNHKQASGLGSTFDNSTTRL